MDLTPWRIALVCEIPQVTLSSVYWYVLVVRPVKVNEHLRIPIRVWHYPPRITGTLAGHSTRWRNGARSSVMDGVLDDAREY